MTRAVKWSVRAAIALALVGGIAWALRPRPIVVQTARATRGVLEATVTAEGKTRVKDLFVVAAPVDGELERIAPKAGDAVSSGMVIARVWPAAPRPLDARSRAEARAAVTAARAAIARAEAAERESAGALTHAESQLATARTLSAAGAAASKDFEHAGHEVEIRRQAVEEGRAALAVARAELVRAEAAAAAANDQSGRLVTPIRSPISGRILRVLQGSAGPVAAGTPLLEVGNVGNIEIVADFLTSDAMSVSPGARATIRDWGGSEPLVARVRQVEPGAFTKVSALGLEEQRVPIVLDLVGAQSPNFGHDFHVTAAIVIWKGEDVLTIPSTALFRAGEDWAVYIVRDGLAHLRRIRVGRSDETRTVIDSGLDAGEEVVIQPSDALGDGSRVAVSPSRTP